MEWNDKFHSILKETERNLSKAKGKLSSKVSSPRKKGGTPNFTLQDEVTHDSPRVKSDISREVSALTGGLHPSFTDMNDSTSMQVMHMQEQIASQNRMIERLQRLVKTLDSEREFYKEEISVLKRDIDMLTNTMKNQSSSINSELKVSNVKNEVMKEINKVKAMVHNFERDSNKRSSLLSPRFDSDFWNIKENMSDNLEQVRFELSEMKRRIDHMEDRLAHNSPLKTGSRHPNLYDTDHLLTRPLYTPTNGAIPRPTDSDLQLLKLSISSMNEKLDNLERRSRPQLPPFQTQLHSSERPNAISSSVPKYSSYLSSHYLVEEDNLDGQSLSDLSDLSNLSDDSNIDDLDLDLMTLNVKDNVELPDSPRFKYDSPRKLRRPGKVEFDLNDLELSDLEEDEEDVNFDPDDLDLNF